MFYLFDIYLSQFTKTDAGFTATDHVLRYVATECPECRWITVTNGDNSYGSEVVARTLSVETNRLNRPAMLISPLDSRNFAEQGIVQSLRWFVTLITLSQTLCFAERRRPGPVVARVCAP
jgi:hypothetical protein